MDKIKCYKCGHIWDYKGAAIYYIACPICRKNIYIKKLREIANGQLRPNTATTE